MKKIGCGLSWQHNMAITQERYEMQVAMRLKRDGWADDVYPQFGDKMYAAIDLERFAELIV